jgi:hypothetical protein
MNACLLAAAAMNSIRNSRSENTSHSLSSRRSETYFNIRFRITLRFLPVRAVKLTNELVLFNDDLRLPKLTVIETDALTLCKQHMFQLPSKECPTGPNRFVQENLDEFTSSTVLQGIKEELIHNYIDDMSRKYNIHLTEGDLDYTVHYSWEVEYE